MKETFIHLDLLDPNPYQPRQHEDPAAIQELAENILRTATVDFDGLLQAPTVRAIGGDRYQLAFGHTRKAAFAYLFSQGHERYNIMRVFVRDLTDVQMFEAAVAENIKRRDLNPIEQAESMRRYMDEFGKTSAEAGEFFNCSEENVRAKVRLLNLPAMAQDKLRAGEINETAARSLLTLTRVLPNNEEALLETVKEIDNGERPEQAVEQVLRSSPNTKIITVNGDEDNGTFSTKAKTFKYLPVVTLNDVKHTLGVQSETVIWEGAIERLYKGDKKTHQEYFSDEPQKLEALDKLAHLIKPPACTACPLFAVIDGFGFCGWVACFDRKKAASEEAELHKVSETVGIAVYSKEDGAAKVISQWNEKHKALFTKKHADLRLRIPGSFNYNNFEGIPSHLQVVVVGKTLEALKKAEEKTAAEIEARHDAPAINYERRRAMQQIRDAQISLFTWEQALPVFAKVLESVVCIDLLDKIDDELITGDFLELPEDAKLSDKDLETMKKKPARLALLRKRVVYKLLDSRMEYTEVKKIEGSKTPVVLFAKHLQELATTWSVKLPKDFLTKAAEHDQAVKLAIAELDKPDKDGAE